MLIITPGDPVLYLHHLGPERARHRHQPGDLPMPMAQVRADARCGDSKAADCLHEIEPLALAIRRAGALHSDRRNRIFQRLGATHASVSNDLHSEPSLLSRPVYKAHRAGDAGEWRQFGTQQRANIGHSRDRLSPIRRHTTATHRGAVSASKIDSLMRNSERNERGAVPYKDLGAIVPRPV